MLRQIRGDWSVNQLAEAANLSVEQIEAVEAGLEPFLSGTVRRRLARALRVPAHWLKEVERLPGEPPLEPVSLVYRSLVVGNKRLPLDAMLENLKTAEQTGDAGFWPCPDCGAGLMVRAFERQTLQGEPLQAVRLNCTQCLFRLEQELEPG